MKKIGYFLRIRPFSAPKLVGDECIIGALAFVPEGMDIPARKVVVGNPAKIVKDVTGEMLQWKTEGTQLYQTFPKAYKETLKEIEPLRRPQRFKPKHDIDYKSLATTKKKKV